MRLRLLPPPPPLRVWSEASPLGCLEALEAEELCLLAVGRCGRPLPEVEDRLERLRLERVELAPDRQRRWSYDDRGDRQLPSPPGRPGARRS